MTELQMGLIGLGACAVIGVLAYNKWQETRQRRQADESLKSRHPDVLLDGGATDAPAARVEPVDEPVFVDADAEEDVRSTPVESGAVAHAGGSARDERVEPVLRLDPLPDAVPAAAASLPPAGELDAAAQHGEAGTKKATGTRGDAGGADVFPASVAEDIRLLSPQIDFIAALDTVEAVAAVRLLDAQHEVASRLRQPLRWIGHNPASGEWEILGQGSPAYRHVRAGLQLVSRQGPVGEGELAFFAAAMQDLAEQLSGVVDVPARQQALEDAARLDQFCARVDIQIGINVVCQSQPFPGTKLRSLAEAAGMTMEAGKRFVRRDDDGNVLFALLNQEAIGFTAESIRSMSTRGVTFLLDVPCVAHGERVFNQMVELARRFAETLRGVVVDDNRRPLSEAALEPIRQQIAQYQAMLAAQQLPAGSPLTQRLFS